MWRVEESIGQTRLTANPNLLIIIPCYNKLGTIEPVIEAVKAASVKNKEIIIVDDYSTDGTRELLQSKLEKTVDRVIYQLRNRGKGAALRTGFAAATDDIHPSLCKMPT